MVDEINKGCCQWASFLNIKQVRDVCLTPKESADREGKEMVEDCCIPNREQVEISLCCSLE